MDGERDQVEQLNGVPPADADQHGAQRLARRESYRAALMRAVATEINQPEEHIAASLRTSDETRFMDRMIDWALDFFDIMGVEPDFDELAAQLDGPPPGAPPPGADADAWLKWREDEKRAGRWWKLAQIAQWSRFSLSKVKKKSSARKRPGTQKTDHSDA